jgi:hypothetical protein
VPLFPAWRARRAHLIPPACVLGFHTAQHRQVTASSMRAAAGQDLCDGARQRCRKRRARSHPARRAAAGGGGGAQRFLLGGTVITRRSCAAGLAACCDSGRQRLPAQG